jgi:uncharacterized protein YbjT (DUF2867 family)
MRTALLAGATGLVGGHLLALLLEDGTWDRVVSIGRREVDVRHDRLEQVVAQLPDVPALPAIDDAFCALGTTIKQAGSRDAFRAVDHDAVVALATGGQQAGARSFLHVTAMGANARSRIFYNRVKGETERDVAALGIPTTVAFRPSIIDGDRAEARRGEQLSLAVMRVAAPVLGPFRPTRAEDIAAAMVQQAKAAPAGTTVVSAREITKRAS